MADSKGVEEKIWMQVPGGYVRMPLQDIEDIDQKSINAGVVKECPCGIYIRCSQHYGNAAILDILFNTNILPCTLAFYCIQLLTTHALYQFTTLTR